MFESAPTPPPALPAHAFHTKPVFGCLMCIEERDSWTCGCGDVQARTTTYCRVCKRRRPKHLGGKTG